MDEAPEEEHAHDHDDDADELLLEVVERVDLEPRGHLDLVVDKQRVQADAHDVEHDGQQEEVGILDVLNKHVLHRELAFDDLDGDADGGEKRRDCHGNGRYEQAEAWHSRHKTRVAHKTMAFVARRLAILLYLAGRFLASRLHGLLVFVLRGFGVSVLHR